jgi:calcium-binding protein CML
MKLVTNLFGSSSSKKEGRRKVSKNTAGAKNASFGSTTSTEEASTPRTVLPPPASSTKPKPVAAVTREELEAALRRVASSEDEVAEMLAEAGAVLEEIASAADEGELKETFAVFDADGDGRISAEELREVLASLGDERCSVDDCRRMIRGVDTDGDGFVCFQEFTRMMMMH